MTVYKMSDYLDYGEYKTVQSLTKNPRLLIAIGIHETGMGNLGAGRQGYYLGYGVPTRGEVQSQYKGLYNQIKYGSQLVEKYVDLENPTQEQLITLGLKGWRPGYYDANNNYVNTGESWAKSIWSIYNNLIDDYSGISPVKTNTKKERSNGNIYGARNNEKKWYEDITEKVSELNPFDQGLDSIKSFITKTLLLIGVVIIALTALVMLLSPSLSKDDIEGMIKGVS